MPEKDPAMLKTIGNAIAAYLLPKLLEFAQLQADKYFPILMEKLLALLPVVAASAGKAVADQIVESLNKMPDIDIPGVSDIFDLTETVRQGVNGAIPDIDIPILSDIFDLTELFNKRP